ncbi:MAG: Ig-like domain-containing protein [Planctomycetota bacterium]|nr:Ig-like domain-containing protein [Planctomycetota bacterium]
MFNNKEQNQGKLWAPTNFLALVVTLATCIASGTAFSQVADHPAPTSQAVVVLGEIENIFVDDMDDMFSAGWIIADGTAVRIPSGLLIDLPANRLTIRDLMAGAPPECLALEESGLGSSDECVRNKGMQGGGAQILANRQPDGFVIAGDVFILKNMTGNVAGGIVGPTVAGSVSYIDFDDGYFVINGIPNEPPVAAGGNDNRGVIVRINDPETRQTIQSGLACNGSFTNCSPDARFCTDPDNYSWTYATGYPACIPSTNSTLGDRPTNSGSGNNNGGANANGVGDPFCPMWNREFEGPIGRTVPDSRFYVPIVVGDPIGVDGNYEIVDGVKFFSAYGGFVQLGLKTKDDDNQPDYIIWDEVENDVPPFDNARIKSLAIGFSTLDSSQVTAYKLHKNPANGADMEYVWGTTVGNLDTTFHGIPPNAGGIFKFGYDIDFLLGAPVPHGPCLNLQNAGHNVCPLGGTLEEETELMIPAMREIIGISHHLDTLNPGVTVVDILGRDAQHGMYITPSGLGHPEFGEINFDKMSFPFIFEGIPWNLDRRLGVGGCDEDQGCESLAADPLGSFPLDPFPASGDIDWVSHSVKNGVPIFLAGKLTGHHPFGPGDTLDAVSDPPGARQFPPELDGLLGVHCDVDNNAPAAAQDNQAAVEDVALFIATADLLNNDSDPDQDLLSLFLVEGSSLEGGSLTAVAGGVSFLSAQDYNGPDQFFYNVTDGHGGVARGSVLVSISAVNDDPVGSEDHFTVVSTSDFEFTDADLLGNDSDVDEDTLSISQILAIDAIQSPGTVTATAGGWTFAPDPNGGPLSSFDYQIDDGNTGSGLSRVHFWVDNSAPTVNDDSAVLNEDTPTAIAVLLNDSDADGDALTVSALGSPGKGSVEALTTGEVLYTPDLDSNGQDNFSYTVTDGKGTETSGTVFLTVVPVNDAPRVTADMAITLEDTPIQIPVLANDYDPEGDNMTVSLPTAAAFAGTATLMPGGVVLFTPFPDSAFGLADNFLYIVTDTHGASTSGIISIQVTPVNDQPIAGPDSAVMLEDTSQTINVLINDTDVDNDLLRVTAVDIPADFPVAVQWDMNGLVTITPDPEFNNASPLSFTYTVSDGFLSDVGLVGVLVIAQNDAPLAVDDLNNSVDEDSFVIIDVLDNDNDLDGDTIQIATITTGLLGSTTLLPDQSIMYTPNLNANGEDLFSYTITDNAGGQATATVAVTINPVNDAPLAGLIPAFPMPEDGVRTIQAATILSVASDADGDSLSIINVQQPSHGTVELEMDASAVIIALIYTPDPNYFGFDEFTYEVTDSVIEGGTFAVGPGLVRFNILPVNDVPIANNDANLTVAGGEVLSIAPLANDSDPDGDLLTLVGLLSGPFHGSSVINSDGTLTYSADDNFEGNDTMIYVVQDGHGGSATATIVVTVTASAASTMAIIRGDANTDGQLDVSDPVETILYLFDGDPVFCLLALDSNDDEMVDLGDIIFSLNNLFSTGADPAAPYPFCGTDPTAGSLPCLGFGLCD